MRISRTGFWGIPSVTTSNKSFKSLQSPNIWKQTEQNKQHSWRLESKKTCYHSVQNLLCSSLLSKNTKLKYTKLLYFFCFKWCKMFYLKFKVCKSVRHYTIQTNQPTRRNNLSSLLLDVYVQLNMFWASSRPSSGAQ